MNAVLLAEVLETLEPVGGAMEVPAFSLGSEQLRTKLSNFVSACRVLFKWNRNYLPPAALNLAQVRSIMTCIGSAMMPAAGHPLASWLAMVSSTCRGSPPPRHLRQAGGVLGQVFPLVLLQRVLVPGEAAGWPAHQGDVQQVDGLAVGDRQAAHRPTMETGVGRL